MPSGRFLNSKRLPRVGFRLATGIFDFKLIFPQNYMPMAVCCQTQIAAHVEGNPRRLKFGAVGFRAGFRNRFASSVGATQPRSGRASVQEPRLRECVGSFYERRSTKLD
jgi:hypothetical protein